MQQRGAAAADFLDAARERGRHFCRIGQLLGIGAEGFANFGEMNIGRQLGLE